MHLVGLYTYYKMMHGAYSIKLAVNNDVSHNPLLYHIALFFLTLPARQPKKILCSPVPYKNFGRPQSRPSCVRSLNPWPEYKTVHNKEWDRFPRTMFRFSVLNIWKWKQHNAHFLMKFMTVIILVTFIIFSLATLKLRRERESFCVQSGMYKC